MNILVVGPHPDDQELGMGGSIAKFLDQGHRVLLLDMTNGEPTPHGDPATRAEEARTAAEVLGADRLTLGFPNRMVEHSLEARYQVAAAIRELQADVLFVPYFEDAHPDHLATTRIAEDARFDAKLTKTDLPGEPVYPKWLFYYYCMHLRQVPMAQLLCQMEGVFLVGLRSRALDQIERERIDHNDPLNLGAELIDQVVRLRHRLNCDLIVRAQ